MKDLSPVERKVFSARAEMDRGFGRPRIIIRAFSLHARRWTGDFEADQTGPNVFSARAEMDLHAERELALW